MDYEFSYSLIWIIGYLSIGWAFAEGIIKLSGRTRMLTTSLIFMMLFWPPLLAIGLIVAWRRRKK